MARTVLGVSGIIIVYLASSGSAMRALRHDPDEALERDADGIFIKTRSMLPSFPDNASVEIFYVEAGIPIAYGLKTSSLDIYHSGVTFVVKDARRWGLPEEMTLQFYATAGMFEAQVPEVKPDMLEVKFNNRAVVSYSDFINHTYWERQHPFGVANGTVLNSYFDFVAEFVQTIQHYQLFAIYVGNELQHPDMVCSSFSEKSFEALLRLGAEWNKIPLRRNTVRVHSRTTPQLSNMSDPKTRQSVFSFFSHITDLVELKVKNYSAMNLSSFLSMVMGSAHVNLTGYIFDGNVDNFISWSPSLEYPYSETYHVMSIFNESLHGEEGATKTHRD